MDHPSAEEAKIILDSITDGVFTVDAHRVITYFNRAAEQITGISSSEAVGRHCWEVFRASICHQCCSLHQTLESGHPVVNNEIFITDSEDKRIPVSITTAPLKDGRNRVVGAVEAFRDLSEIRQLRQELTGRYTFDEIVSKNEKMRRLIVVLESAAEMEMPILLEGERGTGKKHIAKAIHAMSLRKSGPFIAICCKALPEALLETEIFGYTADSKGKTRHDKPGRVALAAGGTLYIDDLDAMPPGLQERLIRVLRDGLFDPLGCKRPQRADVRIVAATSGRLAGKVGPEGFLEDLYQLISVVHLKVPPLRERKEDLPLLIDYYITKHAKLNGKPIESVSPEALPLLMAHDFPGNIRELERIIEYALVVCPEGQIQIEHLPENVYRKPNHRPPKAIPDPLPAVDSLMTVERSFIYKTLMKNAWNRKATAEEMGIHPTTLWRKMKRLNMEMPVTPRGGKRK